MSRAAPTLLSSSSLTSDPARAGRRLVTGPVPSSTRDRRPGHTPSAPGSRPPTPSTRRDLALGLLDWDAGRADEAQGWLEGVVDPK